MLFRISSEKKLEIVNEKDVLEKEIQNLIGKNLEVLMNLTFVDFEFSLENIRIDILAFDREMNAPVIIELKKDNSKSLFDQGMEYFHLLLNRKSDFVLKLHEKLQLPADTKKINWESSRVVFVGKNFSLRQRRAVDFSGIAIELFDYDYFENGFLKLEKIGLQKKSKLEIGTHSKNEKIAEVQKEIVEYDREYHQKNTTPEMWELFEKIENELLSWEEGEISQKFNKDYIAFKKQSNFAEIHLQKRAIEIYFKWRGKSPIPDTKLQLQKIPESYNFSVNYKLKISDEENLDEIFFILKQSLKTLS